MLISSPAHVINIHSQVAEQEMNGEPAMPAMPPPPPPPGAEEAMRELDAMEDDDLDANGFNLELSHTQQQHYGSQFQPKIPQVAITGELQTDSDLL